MSHNYNISMSVIKRLPRYYRFLGRLRDDGYTRISSRELAEMMSVTASQIRQDLNCFGGFGQQGYGYNVEQLYNEIGKILGVKRKIDAIIVGAGNLGRAIASHMNFESRGFNLIGIFDKSKRLIGQEISGVQISSTDDIESFCKKRKPKVAIICLPTASTEAIVDKLVENGIVGFWNYSHFDIASKHPNVEVENVHLSDSLLTLSYQIKATLPADDIQIGCCVNENKELIEDELKESATVYDIIKSGCEYVVNNGYDFAEYSVGTLLKLTDDEVRKLNNDNLNIIVCKNFIPSEFKIVECSDELFDYVEKALKRTDELGIEYIVFGSGAARTIPENMSYEDGIKCIEKFLVRCDEICSKYKTKIVIEPLNKKECNIFNTVEESLETLKKLSLDNILLLADAYHMYRENEPLEILEEASPYLRHIHVAEPYERTYPGQKDGKYLTAFLNKLKEVGYEKTVSVECGFKDFREESILAADFLKKTLN